MNHDAWTGIMILQHTNMSPHAEWERCWNVSIRCGISKVLQGSCSHRNHRALKNKWLIEQLISQSTPHKKTFRAGWCGPKLYEDKHFHLRRYRYFITINVPLLFYLSLKLFKVLLLSESCFKLGFISREWQTLDKQWIIWNIWNGSIMCYPHCAQLKNSIDIYRTFVILLLMYLSLR